MVIGSGSTQAWLQYICNNNNNNQHKSSQVDAVDASGWPNEMQVERKSKTSVNLWVHLARA